MRYSKSYNKQNDVTYVYKVEENYWDKEKKQARNKRKLIGKIDPVTGDIVPTKKRGSTSTETADQPDYKLMYEATKKALEDKEQQIIKIKKEFSDYVNEEKEILSEIEKVLKERKNKADVLEKKYKINGE